MEGVDSARSSREAPAEPSELRIQQSCEMTPPDPTPGHQVIFIKGGAGDSWLRQEANRQ